MWKWKGVLYMKHFIDYIPPRTKRQTEMIVDLLPRPKINRLPTLRTLRSFCGGIQIWERSDSNNSQNYVDDFQSFFW